MKVGLHLVSPELVVGAIEDRDRLVESVRHGESVGAKSEGEICETTPSA